MDDGLFRAALESSHEPFELLAPVRREGRIVDFVWEYANPAAVAAFGAGGHALAGRQVLAGAHDPFHASRCAHWADVMNGVGSAQADFARIGASGTRWYRTRSTRVGDRLAASSSDVTDTIRAIEGEREARERVLGEARARDAFLVKLNHELRTPLNAISGWAHLIGREGVGAPTVKRAAETIARNVRAQAAIVDKLLTMNGIASGTLGFDRQFCDLGKILVEAIESVRPASEARWIEIRRERIATGLGCLGDPGRLGQVFVGLLDNAVRHTPLNGEIEVAAERADRSIHVTIRDTGEGIAAEKLPLVFEMFEQGGAAGLRTHGGLGLGLTIVRSFVELHGGRVWLHSEGEHRGTTAHVELPFAEPPEGDMHAGTRGGSAAAAATDDADPGAGQAGALPLAWRRVLVLEDQTDSLELIVMLLSEQGAIVRAYDSAEQALGAAEHGSFDLIVSDLGMPGMDGLEFMQRLSRHPHAFRAIALTGYADEHYRSQALDAGFTRVVVKPIVPEQFLSVVLAEIGQRN